MNRLQATSRCECQAKLTAVLDDKRHVLHGEASHQGVQNRAPAHSIGAQRENFDIAWLCPFCGRNTLRTFYAGALRAAPAELVLEAPAALPAPAAIPAPAGLPAPAAIPAPAPVPAAKAP